MTHQKVTDQDWRDLREKLLSAAKGRWYYLAPQMAPALEPAAQRMGKHVECPFDSAHRDRKKRFRLDEKSGMAFCTCSKQPIHAAVYHLSGLTHGRFLIELANLLGMEEELPEPLQNKPRNSRPATPPPPPRVLEQEEMSEEERMKRSSSLKRALSRGVRPEPGGILATYMATRGIPFGADGDVFEVESEPYNIEIPEKHREPNQRKFVTLGHFNAIVHVVRNKHGKAAGLNKIFVTDGRKIRPEDFLDLPRWVDPESDVPAKRRSNYLDFPDREAYVVVRRGSGSGRFHACEGIECAWAIAASTDPKDTVVAHLSNTILEKNSIARPEKKYQSLWIWGDHDRSQAGDNSAVHLLYKSLGRDMPSRVMLPYAEIPDGEKSLDWDYLFKALGLKEMGSWMDRLKALYPYADKQLFELRDSIGDL